MKIFLSCLLLWTAGALPVSLRAVELSDLKTDAPLTLAAASGDTAALTRLLDQGVSPDAPDSEGRTALVCASIMGKKESVRLLLARHADPNKPSARSGTAPLDFALNWKHEDLVPLLLDAGANPNGFRTTCSLGETWSPLFIAQEKHFPDAIKLLLSHGARIDDKNDHGTTVLMESSKSVYVDQVALLIEQGANVNASNDNGFTALIYAAWNGREESVRLLLAKGANIHAIARNYGRPYGVLEAATEQGHADLLEILTAAGATPAQAINQLNEQLNAAIEGNDYERVQAALGKGASANAPASHGVIPITVAVLKGNPGIVRLLIKAGADVNATPPDSPGASTLSLVHERLENEKEPQKRHDYAQVEDLLRKAGAVR